MSHCASNVLIQHTGIIVIFTRLLSVPLGYLRQPRVIAEVIGGVLLGPSVFGHIPHFTDRIFPSNSIVLLTLTANIGLVFFLFLVGLEIDTRVIKRNAERICASGYYPASAGWNAYRVTEPASSARPRC